MQADFWSTYSIAPVFSILHNNTSADWINEKLSDSAICVKSSKSENYVEDLKSAYDQSVALFVKKLEEDVRPAFQKFDKDGSGAIDRGELQALMKDLGQELDDDQTTRALRDLDLNKDGVVDFDEFTKWYFAGMKSYSGARRTLLKVGQKSKKLIESLADEAKNALLCEELKTKTNKISIGYNAPEVPKT